MTGRRAGWVSAACLLAICLTPAAGSADPIVVTITSGSADLQTGAPSVADILGTEGFSINTRIAPQAVSLGDLLPGETGTVFVDALGLDLVGARATLRGVSYRDIGGPLSPVGAELIFRSAPFVAPPISPSNVSVQAPFTFGASLQDASEGGLTARLQGRGTMTADLRPVLSGDSSFWFFEHARFDFASAVAPTPEPTSILLLGTAAAGFVAVRRRRQ